MSGVGTDHRALKTLAQQRAADREELDGKIFEVLRGKSMIDADVSAALRHRYPYKTVKGELARLARNGIIGREVKSLGDGNGRRAYYSYTEAE